KKLPFGVFQIGKAYRNEISPRQHVMRMREFTQAEGQMFVFPEQKDNWKRYENISDCRLPLWPYQMQENDEKPKDMKVKDAIKNRYFKNKAYAWAVNLSYVLFTEIGIPKENIRLRQHTLDERAFYADDAWDLEIKTNSFGWVECCGIHDRADYDLTQHAKASGKKLEAMDENNIKIVPHIIEIAFGTDRPVFALLDINYKKNDERTILTVPKDIAPINVAVFPLVKKEGLAEIAEGLTDDLIENHGLTAIYDAGGSIGRRYARMDEKGTPVCITVDFETKENNTVTIRDRDTQEQKRIKVEDIPKTIDDIIFRGKDITDVKK
ncbi:MAG: glycine--tRNA ligase, partial [Candidatus Aenigmarchaeota archaeon]|nr:glycine--tRNA ligase [Candidatus Aenigmarchaeota archaeon]